jgi:hypothetical protein
MPSMANDNGGSHSSLTDVGVHMSIETNIERG